MRRIHAAWTVGRFLADTIVLYHHHWRPRPKGVEHLMHWGDGQAMWCKCGRTFR